MGDRCDQNECSEICCTALLVAGMATVASAASATGCLITATGTVTNGADELGIFGAPSSDISGERATLTFTYDPSLGISINNSGFIEKYGGARVYTSPILSESVTINGLTSSTRVAYDDFVYEDIDNNYNAYATDVAGDNVQIYGTYSGLPTPLSLTTPLLRQGLIGNGEFLFSQDNVETYANLSIDQVVVTEINGGSGAPEPGTAVPGRTATASRSTENCATSCSTARSSTRSRRPRS